MTRNPGGVRFGSAEIYDVIDICFVPGPTTPPEQVIVDCLAIGQYTNGGADERVVLFIKLQEGCTLTSELEKRIKAEIRARRTARHVPERVSTASALCLFPSGHCVPRFISLIHARVTESDQLRHETDIDHPGKRYTVYVKWKASRGSREEGESSPIIFHWP